MCCSMQVRYTTKSSYYNHNYYSRHTYICAALCRYIRNTKNYRTIIIWSTYVLLYVDKKSPKIIVLTIIWSIIIYLHMCCSMQIRYTKNYRTTYIWSTIVYTYEGKIRTYVHQKPSYYNYFAALCRQEVSKNHRTYEAYNYIYTCAALCR